MGLGSALYALAKSDGRLQPEEIENVLQVLNGEPQLKVVLEAFAVQDRYNISVQEAYNFAFRRFQTNRKHFDDDTKRHFVGIMESLANAHDDVSRKERDLIKRFRRDLNKL
jgi:uncharacterized tellurite resistance protein B-like protein